MIAVKWQFYGQHKWWCEHFLNDTLVLLTPNIIPSQNHERKSSMHSAANITRKPFLLHIFICEMRLRVTILKTQNIWILGCAIKAINFFRLWCLTAVCDVQLNYFCVKTAIKNIINWWPHWFILLITIILWFYRIHK